MTLQYSFNQFSILVQDSFRTRSGLVKTICHLYKTSASDSRERTLAEYVLYLSEYYSLCVWPGSTLGRKLGVKSEVEVQFYYW